MIMKIVKEYRKKKYFNWTWTLLDFVLFLCQYFLHNLVKYYSIFKILDNFEQLKGQLKNVQDENH